MLLTQAFVLSQSPSCALNFSSCVSSCVNDGYCKTSKIKWSGTDMMPQSGKGWAYISQGPTGDPTNGAIKYTVGTLDTSFQNSTGDQLHIKLVNYPDGKEAVRMVSSIRIYTTQAFNSGLFVFDVAQIPYGYAVWPSIWLNGMLSNPQNAWAYYGEIDVIEGGWYVYPSSNYNQNTLSLHTQAPCIARNMTANGNDQCYYNGGGQPGKTCGLGSNEVCPFVGCSNRWPPLESNAYAAPFRSAGGGIYAMRLTPEGEISAWFISAANSHYHSIRGLDYITPHDLDEHTTPENRLYADTTGCSQSFRGQQITIDTTFCGDAFNQTGRQYCYNPDLWNTYINNPEFVANATWKINSIQVFDFT